MRGNWNKELGESSKVQFCTGAVKERGGCKSAAVKRRLYLQYSECAIQYDY
jgi:hypothetical protein